MPKEALDIGTILETVPLPGFIALHDGSIVYANKAMLTVAGQPDLVEMDRTVFGLGIFHNPAEYRGFLQSYRHGGNTRRLVIPVGRLVNASRSLVLFASRITFRGMSALCGIISRTTVGSEILMEAASNEGMDVILDKIETFVMRVDISGVVKFANLPLLLELGLERKDGDFHLTRIDVEHDNPTIIRFIKSALATGSSEYETSLQRRNGTLIPVKVILKPVRKVEYKDQFILTAYDVSESRRQEGELQSLELELQKLSTQLERRSILVNEKFGDRGDYQIISRSPAYARVLQQINQVATTDSTVLITGETGTGKELIARAIHARSLRASRPLLILNCGALPAELIESELFGYRRGAFTGANSDHLGRFELADEGTLFLDEIGEMPMLLQTRLLRVLQDGEFTPLGAKEPIQTNVRIIAATNRDLRRRVSEGTFRPDLYFRLNVFPIHSLPLRERKEDIPALVDHFIRKHKPPGRPTPRVRPYDMETLMEYSFEGNVRELENLIQRALILSDGDSLEIPLDRKHSTASQNGTRDAAATPQVLDFVEMQRHHIISVLQMTGGKVSGKGGAAELLGLNPQTLFSKMRKLDISRHSGR